MPTASRTFSRLSAATLFVALLAATFVTVTGGAADAAQRKRAFQPPTRHTLVATVCEQVDENTWDVTYRWRVRGGRYLNLGNHFNFKHRPDNVYRGGRRTIITRTQINGWGEGPAAAPETDTAWYSHVVAPIGNRSGYVTLRDTREVNLDCG